MFEKLKVNKILDFLKTPGLMKELERELKNTVVFLNFEGTICKGFHVEPYGLISIDTYDSLKYLTENYKDVYILTHNHFDANIAVEQVKKIITDSHLYNCINKEEALQRVNEVLENLHIISSENKQSFIEGTAKKYDIKTNFVVGTGIHNVVTIRNDVGILLAGHNIGAHTGFFKIEQAPNTDSNDRKWVYLENIMNKKYPHYKHIKNINVIYNSDEQQKIDGIITPQNTYSELASFVKDYECSVLEKMYNKTKQNESNDELILMHKK